MEDISKPFEKTTLWRDVKKITDSKDVNIEYELRAMIHTEKEDIPVFKIITIDIVRDYSASIGDNNYVELKIPLGDYVKRIFPYRNNLEFSIKKVPKDKKIKTSIDVKRYRAIFLESDNPKVGNSDYSRYSTEHLNTMNILDIKFQILDMTVETTRLLTISGVFKNVRQADLIYSALLQNSNQIQINGKPVVDGVDIVNIDNSTPIKQVVIPDGTTLSSLPTYLHEKAGGLYNAGIGTYFQVYKNKKLWFVYPVAKTSRFSENVDKITFYAVPDQRLKTIDKTYRVENTVTHVIVTGGKSYTDSGELSFMNDGVGFRTSDARAFMKKPVVMTKDGPKGIRSNLNTEVIGKDRKDNINFAPMSGKRNPDRGITINQFVEASQINLRKLSRVDVVWENGDIDLIYPGMPCKYVFLQVNKVIELKGTVLAAHSLTSVVGNSSTSTQYKTSLTITLGLEPYEETPIVSDTKPSWKF